jgi:hypothetical protein
MATGDSDELKQIVMLETVCFLYGTYWRRIVNPLSNIMIFKTALAGMFKEQNHSW